MRLYLDIETIGTDDSAVIADIAAGITPPGNISKAETIAAWETEKKPILIEDAVRKTSFDGGLGQIICFGYAFDESDVQTVTASTGEKALLDGIARSLSQVRTASVVGHNVSWDARFLWQRFIVNGVRPPAWLVSAVKAKPWDIEDTMTMWNPDRERRISLDKLCKVLRVPSPKGDMDGSKVWDAYKAGRINDIVTYCAGDVAAMRECHRKMTA